jgi:hypothetical protein
MRRQQNKKSWFIPHSSEKELDRDDADRVKAKPITSSDVSTHLWPD